MALAFTRSERIQAAGLMKHPACPYIMMYCIAMPAATCMLQQLVWRKNCLAAEAFGGIQEAMQGMVHAERMAVIAAMKCLYWHAKNETAHNTKY